MKQVFLAATLSLCALPAFAKDVRALATEYVTMPAVQNMMTDMFSPETMTVQFRASLPAGVNIADDKVAKIGALLSETMAELKPSMDEKMIEATVRHFSEGEIQSMIDFYSSEHGASIMSKMSVYMAEFMGELGPEIQATNARIYPEIQKILAE